MPKGSLMGKQNLRPTHALGPPWNGINFCIGGPFVLVWFVLSVLRWGHIDEEAMGELTSNLRFGKEGSRFHDV